MSNFARMEHAAGNVNKYFGILLPRLTLNELPISLVVSCWRSIELSSVSLCSNKLKCEVQWHIKSFMQSRKRPLRLVDYGVCCKMIKSWSVCVSWKCHQQVSHTLHNSHELIRMFIHDLTFYCQLSCRQTKCHILILLWLIRLCHKAMNALLRKRWDEKGKQLRNFVFIATQKEEFK